MNPIIEKDLRTTARSMRFFRFIMIFLLIASALLIWLLSLKRDYSRSGHDNVLVVMFCVQAACLALAIPAFACTAINGERERRTFDLLRISALKPSQIVRGKFFAIMLYLGVFVIAFLPVMAACSLFGGFEEVVIDSAPVLASSNAAILATLVDEVVLVLRAGKSTRDEVHAARHCLAAVGAKIVGVVLNAVHPRKSPYGYYGYGYGYSYVGGQDKANT